MNWKLCKIIYKNSTGFIALLGNYTIVSISVFRSCATISAKPHSKVSGIKTTSCHILIAMGKPWLI